jgi:uncharacterized surface anchored protein
LNVDGFKVDEEDNFLPGTLYGMYDAQGRQLAVTEVNNNGRFLFQEVRFDLFFNKDNNQAKVADTYVREIQTVDDDKYSLDYKKYYLPNLEGKFDDYKMGDVILLSSEKKPFVNKFLRGSLELVKVDEKDNENLLPNATFKFERLTGREQATEGEQSQSEATDANDETDEREAKQDKTEATDAQAVPDIDVKQTFELTTDAEGQIEHKDLLYGDWCVTEVKSPDGYILPTDNEGRPTNQLCFTINNETRKVSLKFYNQKKPEVLVSTGSNQSGLYIALGVAIVLLSICLLILAKRNNFAKSVKFGFLGIIMVWGILIGGATFAAAEVTGTKPAELFNFLGSKKMMHIQTATTSYKIDPTDNDDNAIFDPIEGTEPVDETPTEIGGSTSVDPTDESADGANETEDADEVTTASPVETPVRQATAKGWLVSTGEQVGLLLVVGIVIVVTSGAVLWWSYVNKRNEQRSEQ